MPRILWICRNANMRRACWGQTSCQDRPARARWPTSHSLCELRHSHTLPAMAKLKAPLGMRNCAGSCSHPLEDAAWKPGNLSSSSSAKGTLDPASPSWALINSNLTLST